VTGAPPAQDKHLKYPALAGPRVEDALWSWSGTKCLRPPAPDDGLAMLERQLGQDAL
jgi:hypothetical protein